MARLWGINPADTTVPVIGWPPMVADPGTSENPSSDPTPIAPVRRHIIGAGTIPPAGETPPWTWPIHPSMIVNIQSLSMAFIRIMDAARDTRDPASHEPTATPAPR